MVNKFDSGNGENDPDDGQGDDRDDHPLLALEASEGPTPKVCKKWYIVDRILNWSKKNKMVKFKLIKS